MTTESDSNPSQPAEPTDSATPTTPPEAQSAPVEADGSTEAAPPKTEGEPLSTEASGSSSIKAGAAPPDPANEKDGEKTRRPPSPKYSLKAREKTYKRRKDEVRGINDAIIQSDLAGVEEAFLEAAKAGTSVSSASATYEDAKTTWFQKRAPLYTALSKVGALLNLTTAGKELYKACKATTKMGWAENITKRLPPDGLGLPSVLTDDLRTQVTQAKPYSQAYEDALQKKNDAAAGFDTARTQLDGNLEALYGSYRRYVGAKKAGKAAAEVSAPPQPANGAAAKHASPARNVVKNGTHRA